ncbi:MAG: putative acetyltransferase protein [Hyphomicrobiales bacterium]|nr:putative acetyltransferase protein [Hyphomicrobiales bacterium]
MASPSVPRFQAFSLQDDPRGLWTAEEDGRPVGFAWSWACEDFWFLAQLFVKPGLQGGGVGRTLLQRTLAHAADIGARNRALITFAFNTVSQGLYIQHGFLPRFPLYLMSIPRERFGGHVPDQVLEVSPLDGSDAETSLLSELDRFALGFSRAKHHGLLAGEPGIRALGFSQGGRLVGYCYISQSGHIGPFAVASPELAVAGFETALAVAAEGAVESISCLVPGSNASVLRCAAAAGLRIKFPMLAMSTDELGNWSCYLSRNPGFM